MKIIKIKNSSKTHFNTFSVVGESLKNKIIWFKVDNARQSIANKEHSTLLSS